MSKRVTPITPLPGVPDQLIQVLNSRFRELTEAPGAQTVITRISNNGGTGGSVSGPRSQPVWVTDFVYKSVDIRDGALHQLGDVYSTLADAQKDYLFATALTQSVAWAAIQKAIYTSSYVYLPIGSYWVNWPIDVTNKQYGGLQFFGAGQQWLDPELFQNLTIDATDPTKITNNEGTSQPHAFSPWHKWRQIQITGGTGFTAGTTVTIVSVVGGVATCSGPVGTKGATGGTGVSSTCEGSRIIGRTGAGNGDVLFDFSGTGNINLHDFAIDSSAVDATSSTIGMLFGRTYEQQDPESSLIYIARVPIVMAALTINNIGANGCLTGYPNLGSIAVVNWCSENLTVEHCYWQADRTYFGQNQLPMSVCDDFPMRQDGSGVWHGQPECWFLPVSPCSRLKGGDLATPVHITAVTVSGSTLTYTTTENLTDPTLFPSSGGWKTGDIVTVRGVNGLGPYANVTNASVTVNGPNSFSANSAGAITGGYAGGGQAFLFTWFSEGVDTFLSCSLIALKGPAVTIGGVSMFKGVNIYTLSYHPSQNPDIQAPYQIVGACFGIDITGASEQTSRILYSRAYIWDFRFDVDAPNDPDPGISRIWIDGEAPDPNGATLVPAIVAGSLRVNPPYDPSHPHHLLEGNTVAGPVAARFALGPFQDLYLPGGEVNAIIENSEGWSPAMPTAYVGIYDFATQYGRREIGGAVSFTGPYYGKGASLRINALFGPDTDSQISLVDTPAGGDIVIHTFAPHFLQDGQLVTMLSVSGVTTSAPVTAVACHVIDSQTVSIPGISGTGPYQFGGILRPVGGRDSYFGFFDAGSMLWSFVKSKAGNFSLYDSRLGQADLNCDRTFMTIGATGISYTDLAIGADPTTVTSTARPFYDPISVGQQLTITGGSGFTLQTVTVLAVTGNVAKCSASLGAPGSVGGTAFNPFTTEILGDAIVFPQHKAATGTNDYLLVDAYGTLVHWTKAQVQADLETSGAGGGLIDPTTTLGDLIVRGPTPPPTRLGVGANGDVLTADSTQTLGVKWAPAGAGSQTPWMQDIDGQTYTLNTTGVVRAAGCFGVDKDSGGAWNNLVAIRPFDLLFALAGGSLTRWDIYRTGTELGDGTGLDANANTGSDLVFYRYSDPGNYLGAVMAMIRKTGFIGVNMASPSYQLHVKAAAGAIAVYADTGYIWSDGGFNSPFADPSAVNIPNGGATFGLGVAVVQGVYMHSQMLGALNAPAANYGGIAYTGGTTYAYWNPAGAGAWTAFDFSLLGQQTPWRSDIDGHGYSLTGANEVAASAGCFAGTNTDTVAIRPTDILIANSPAQTRWDIAKVGAETGTPTAPTNVGSDLYFYRYNDAGNYLGQVLMLIRATGFVGINMPNPSSQLQVKAAAAANVAIHADTGYVLSDAGFNSPSADPQALNVQNGGGIFGLGLAIGQALYPKANVITALNAPAATYGGLAYTGGSVYAYYDNTSGSAGWKQIDFKGASQSPWLTDINGNGKSLNGALSVNLTGTAAGCTVTTGADEVIVGATGVMWLSATNGAARWFIEKEDSESSTDLVGSNLHISRYNNAGSQLPIGSPTLVVALQRSTGWVGINIPDGSAPAAQLHVAGGSCQADSGFYTPSTGVNAIQAPNGGALFGIGVSVTGGSWNSIQSSGGIRVSGALQAGPDFPSSPDPGALAAGFLCWLKGGGTTVVATVVDGYGATPAVIGRAAGGGPGAESPPGNQVSLLALSGRGATGPNSYIGSGAAQIVLRTSEPWGPNNNGAEIVLQTVPNGSPYGGRQDRMYVRNSGLVEIVGIGTFSAGVTLDTGYFQSIDGYLATGTEVNVFSAPNGGASIWLALYLGQQGGAPHSPLANYGGLAWKGGSVYWYWAGGSFATVDFSTVGAATGVTHLNGIAGDVSLAQGSNILISPNVPVPGQISVSVSASPTFTGTATAAALASSAASGSTAPLAFYLTSNLFSVDGNGILNCRGINVGGNFACDHTGVWSLSVQTNSEVYGGSFGINGKAVGAGSAVSGNVLGLPAGDPTVPPGSGGQPAFSVACSDGFSRPVRAGLICSQ